MLKIEGIVCDAFFRPSGEEILFGPHRGEGQHDYESFASNGLVTFSSDVEARRAQRQLEQRTRDFSQVLLAKIKMGIAETVEETFSLDGRSNLIVLKYGQETASRRTIELIGTREHLAEDARTGLSYIPGAHISLNGMQPFPTFERAYRCMEEATRQAGPYNPTRMATFDFERLGI